MKFTDYAIKALKPRKRRYEIYAGDSTGFGIRVSERGVKSWITRYRRNGRLMKITHGRYPGLSLAEARLGHHECRKLLHKGIDAASTFRAQKQQEREAGSVAELAAEYLERYAKVHKRSWREDQRMLRKDVLPAWGKRRAKDIARRDVIQLLDRIIDRGAPIGANRTLALLSRMFRFAIERGLLDASPVVAIKQPGRERQRDRVLRSDEIRNFWLALDKANMHVALKLALKLMLVTAQRRGEIIGAHLSEFDLETQWWTIPAEHSKNGFSHRVPLSPLALELVEALKAIAGDSEWLVASPYGDKSMTHRALTRAITNTRDVFGIEHFTAHDLRRTAASHMTGMGIARLVVKKILNHVESDITAVYDRHTYDNEKRQALDAWARRLRVIFDDDAGANVVVPMPSRGVL